MKYFMTQWYVFQDLSEDSLLRIRKDLLEIGKTHDMNGLILVAREGCNGTVAGSAEAIETITAYLEQQFGKLPFQHWESEVKPFRRFKVDVRNEIVALKKPGILPKSPESHLPPKQFHEMLEREDVTVLDTRNWYETNIGSFKDAIIPDTKSFQEFPKFVEQSNIPKDKPVVMFCTSGIRCEKAAEEMKQQGYQEVYQLDGGITNYFKEIGQGNWEGECFMFDHRVAVDASLQPSKKYSLCRMCGNPGDIRAACASCQKECAVCALCTADAQAYCSKQCRANLRLAVIPAREPESTIPA